MTPSTLHPFEQHLLTHEQAHREHAAWTPEYGALPAIYLSHGAPPLFEDPGWMHDLSQWALAMPKPRSILIVSAHWESAPLMLSAPAAHTPLVYDFGGFDPYYYHMQYRTPDASELAADVAALIPDDQSLHEHNSRGLDHGAWVPLKVMYPFGDIPTLQLSLPTNDPTALMQLGQRLAPLREQGVLVIGSGFMTHGLPFLTAADFLGVNDPPRWSQDFDQWAAEALERADIDELSRYRSVAPGMPYAHPTVEHLTPLFVALGAATDIEVPADTVLDGFRMGLARRSLSFA